MGSLNIMNVPVKLGQLVTALDPSFKCDGQTLELIIKIVIADKKKVSKSTSYLLFSVG